MKARAGVILIAALFGSAGCSGEGLPSTDEAVFPDEALTTVIGEESGLVLEVRTSPKQPPSRGILAVEYVVTDAEGNPRDDLEIGITPWMPAMGHGSAKQPPIEAKGGGRYVASDIRMFMSGEWELRTAIAGGVEDHAIVSFEIP